MGDDDELRMLRRRAYGPDADIVGDDAALARLAALERRSRAQDTAQDTADAVDGPVADPALAALGFGGDVATRDGPRGVREEFGDDAALRFVVSGDDVLVYVVRPDPNATPAQVDPA